MARKPTRSMSQRRRRNRWATLQWTLLALLLTLAILALFVLVDSSS